MFIPPTLKQLQKVGFLLRQCPSLPSIPYWKMSRGQVGKWIRETEEKQNPKSVVKDAQSITICKYSDRIEITIPLGVRF